MHARIRRRCARMTCSSSDADRTRCIGGVVECPEMCERTGADRCHSSFSERSRSTVDRGGERRPETHHGTPKYGCPRRCRRARSRSPGRRNRRWIERRLRDFSTDPFLRHRPSATRPHVSTTTSSITTSTTVASVPAVLSCGPGPTPHVRPTTLTVGCATKVTTVTGITWSAWDASAGGQGTGTVKRGFPECSGDRGRVP